MDTWWQTETGTIMISPLPGVTDAKPGAAMTALPGIAADVVDANGNSVPNGAGGYLVLTEPWPSMLRTIWGDDERYIDTYWSKFPGIYFAGDGAKKDEDGDIWLLGRVDDVHERLRPSPVDDRDRVGALVSNPKVAEAAVVGASDEITGQAVVAFVILRTEAGDGGEHVVKELRDHVAKADRQDRPAAADHGRRRAAEDALRQDHAAPAARCRREPPRSATSRRSPIPR